MERETKISINGGAKRPSVVDAARGYLRRGWAPVPIPPRKKKPVLKDWTALRLQEADLAKRFRANSNIGLILGEASGWLVDVDLDCDEAIELADQYLPPTLAVTGRPSAPKSHRWYIVEGAKTEQHRDPQTNDMMVELRSTGGQTVVGPSIHPDDGDIYEILNGEPAKVPEPMLKACVRALAKEIVKVRYGDSPPPPKRPRANASANTASRTFTTDVDVETRAVAYLEKMSPAISGQGGHPATYAAATALVHGFGTSPERALEILEQYYNPRCQPPWSTKELQHKVNDAATKSHDRPFGWLRDSEGDPPPIRDDPTVDISAIVEKICRSEDKQSSSRHPDPGSFPRHLLNVPGFIGDVMAYNLATAFKPQPILALGATLALLGTLTGRKIADRHGTRTNIYCLGICRSGGGKERARQVNKDILYRAGLDGMAGPEGIASHAGLISAVERQRSILFQLDEIGRMLKTLAEPNRSPHLYHIATVLMKLFTTSSSVFISDAYADSKRNKRIYQPHVCLYGTTVPQSLYEGLSIENLTDGFYSRMMGFESDDDDPEPQQVIVTDIPDSIVEVARYWGDFNPGGNLAKENPQPRIVEYALAAQQMLHDLEQRAREERRGRTDAVLAIWTRTTEKACKLALLYACSVNHEEPFVDEEAASWATELSEYLTRKMIAAASDWVSENAYEQRLKRLSRDIRAAGQEGLTGTEVSRKTKHINKKERDELLDRLEELGEIRKVREETGGAPRFRYIAC